MCLSLNYFSGWLLGAWPGGLKAGVGAGRALRVLALRQEAYSVARQFNLIPPICEQAEYHMFQREKVEVQLPELFHKIGTAVGVLPQPPPPPKHGAPQSPAGHSACPWGS